MLSVVDRKIKTVVKKPATVLIKILYAISPMIGDKLYLKLLFPLMVGYKLDLDNPKTYNEKLQWLKLYYRKPELSNMVDKFEVKKVVENIIGKEYVVENYGIWNSFDEINFDELPEQFVLKTTHDQGGVVICNNKNQFNFLKAKTKLNRHLRKKHYYLTREWFYKSVKPRIMAEELLIDKNKEDLWDYKFFCFNGVPKVVMIATDRQSGKPKFDFFDINFNHLDIVRGGETSDISIKKPKNFNLMIDLSRKLSNELPHVRIDFYSIEEKVFFGEYTFFNAGGMGAFEPECWDAKFGEWIDLPNKQK